MRAIDKCVPSELGCICAGAALRAAPSERGWAITARDMKKFRRLNETFYVESCGFLLGLVDLSRIPSGACFREVHPGSEMASQNDQNDQNKAK